MYDDCEQPTVRLGERTWLASSCLWLPQQSMYLRPEILRTLLESPMILRSERSIHSELRKSLEIH